MSLIQNTKYKIRDTGLKGFTIIEALVFLFIFALVSVVFYQTYSVGTRMIIESKNRLGATALANQKMEIIRSIAYDDIGTTSGVPSGTLAENESISVNTTRYNVHIYVRYMDDPFDGTLGGSPNDAIPNDYKQVRLTVSWGNGGTDQQVSLFGNFSPNGIETSAGGGVLSINVLDAAGSGVSGASVHVSNPASSVNFTASTDSTGNVTSVGAPAGTQKYALTVSKSGYYSVQTYAPTATFTPTDPHASVVAMALNQASLVMDQAVGLHFRTEDPFGTAVPSVSLSVSGGKYIGTDTSLATPDIYSFTQSFSTDGSGEKNFSGESFGIYTVKTATKSGFTFYKVDPATGTAKEADVTPGTDQEIKVLMLDNAVSSLWVKAVDASDTTVGIAGASVHLSDSVSGYDVTVTADAFGYAFFPEALPALVAGTYDLEVSATGYGTESGTVSIGGSALQTETVELTAS